MQRKGFQVGIDLGTTFTVAAYLDQAGSFQIIQDEEGARKIASAIFFDQEETIVGNFAAANAGVYPGQVAQNFKRYMGVKDFYFHCQGKRYSAVDLSSLLLEKIRDDIESQTGFQPEEVVITVPAYFGDPQRRATLEAAEKAGLKVIQLLNEPTAAAYSYGIHNLGSRQRVLVFDLGGGTFDVTVIEIDGEKIEVRATGGDHQLGGLDWDRALADYLAEKFHAYCGVNLYEEEQTEEMLLEKATKAKIGLSSLSRVDLSLQAGGHILKLEIRRERFEEITRSLVERCRLLTEMVLEEAGLTVKKIDRVLPVGGSTRMPMIPALLQSLFGFPPAAGLNPEECVAIGAAIKASLLQAEKGGSRPVYLNRKEGLPLKLSDRNATSHSFGFVVLKDGKLHNSIVIPKNSLYPCEKSRSDYTTTYPDQPSLEVILTEGEDPDPYNCSLIGGYEAYDLPPAPAGGLKLRFTFRYNLNQLIEVEAFDLTHGRPLPVRSLPGEPNLAALQPLPMDVALLLDCSGSMAGWPIEEAKRAALIFIENFSHPQGRIALITFPGGVRHTLETRREYLPAEVKKITAIGGTPMTEALEQAREKVLGVSTAERVIVLLTDGQPDDPGSAAMAAEKAAGAGIRLITIGVTGADKAFLRRIASSEEDFHWVGEPLALTSTFANIASELSAGATIRRKR